MTAKLIPTQAFSCPNDHLLKFSIFLFGIAIQSDEDIFSYGSAVRILWSEIWAAFIYNTGKPCYLSRCILCSTILFCLGGKESQSQRKYLECHLVQWCFPNLTTSSCNMYNFNLGNFLLPSATSSATTFCWACGIEITCMLFNKPRDVIIAHCYVFIYIFQPSVFKPVFILA